MKQHLEFEQSICVSEKDVPPGKKSLENLELFRMHVARSNYAGLFGITLKRGAGAHVEDVDGNRYLDCLAGASANVLGYGVKEVAESYHNVALTMQHSCVPYSLNEQVPQLAKTLVQYAPPHPDKQWQAMFGLSGSDAVGGALCAARRYTGNYGVMYFKNAYHGSTGLSQQASGFATLKTGLYPEDVNFIALDFPYFDERDLHGSHERSKATLKLIERHLKTNKVGALISEPIQGDGGVHLPMPGFFAEAKKLLEQYNALLIIDEVQSGMGRTGAFWAIEHEEITPDILVSAKGLAAGFAPISSIMGRREVLESLESAQQIFTYTGHGPSCAAALKTIQLIQRDQVIGNAKKQGDKLLEGLKQIQADFPTVINQVRGRGLMIGVEINTADNAMAAKLFATRGVQLGIYFGFFGNANQVVRIEPPLIINDRDVDDILRVTEQVAEEMANDNIPGIAYRNTMKYGQGL